MERVINILKDDGDKNLREVSFDVILNCVLTGISENQYRWFLERGGMIAVVKSFVLKPRILDVLFVLW